MAADFLVKFGSLRAHFPHVAQHEQVRSGQLGQHVDGGAHRVWVGVVGVVHPSDGLTLAHHCKCTRAAFDGLKRRQALGNHSE